MPGTERLRFAKSKNSTVIYSSEPTAISLHVVSANLEPSYFNYLNKAGFKYFKICCEYANKCVFKSCKLCLL